MASPPGAHHEDNQELNCFPRDPYPQRQQATRILFNAEDPDPPPNGGGGRVDLGLDPGWVWVSARRPPRGSSKEACKQQKAMPCRGHGVTLNGLQHNGGLQSRMLAEAREKRPGGPIDTLQTLPRFAFLS